MKKKVKITELSEASVLEGLWILGVDASNKGVKAAMSLLKGLDGKEVEMRVTATALQYRLTGGTWKELLTIAKIQQPAVDAAAEVRKEIVQISKEVSQVIMATNTAKEVANIAAGNANTAAGLANTAATAANIAKDNANAAAGRVDAAITNAENATSAANTAAGSVNDAKNAATVAATSANTAAGLASSATTAANTAKDAANTAAGLANTAATAANVAKDAANTAVGSANSAADNANGKATLANNAATSANTAATNANTKAGLADTAATNANTKAGLANTAATNANTEAGKATTAAGLANAKAGLADTAAERANTAAEAAESVVLGIRPDWNETNAGSSNYIANKPILKSVAITGSYNDLSNKPTIPAAYTHPALTARTSGLYKITVNAEGHVADVVAVTKADITTLGIPAQDTNTTYLPATAAVDGLMSKADKTKLDGVAASANNYIHPAYTAKASGLYKITVDATGHISTVTAATKADITALGIPAQDTVYTHPVGAGNTHIPTGGAAGQFLKWSAAGAAVWAADNNTTYGIATTAVDGLMSKEDKARLDKAVVPNDIGTVSLGALPITKYSLKYTYTSATPIAISFAATPAEGQEFMLDILNSTAADITQPIPNAAAWQCDDTSVVLPAGKVTGISIRYVHGKYCVRF